MFNVTFWKIWKLKTIKGQFIYVGINSETKLPTSLSERFINDFCNFFYHTPGFEMAVQLLLAFLGLFGRFFLFVFDIGIGIKHTSLNLVSSFGLNYEDFCSASVEEKDNIT